MTRVFGWDPSLQGDKSTAPPHPKSGQIITFPLDCNNPPKMSSEKPDYSGFHRPKKGDPDWVPRPKNAFFIFRNEFVHRHAWNQKNPDSSRVKQSTLIDKTRTMSKRAGEAWHKLSKAEKDHFKALAALEKAAHAKAHPGYRFQPAKRSPCVPHVATSPSSPLPKVSERERPSKTGASVRGCTTTSFKPRSSSVPLHPSVPSSFLVREEEQVGALRRRSKSHAILPAKELATPEPFLGFDYTSRSPTAGYSSPLSTSSTLAGWNGEPLAPSVRRVPSPVVPPASTPSSWTMCPSSDLGYQHPQIFLADNSSTEQFYRAEHPGLDNYVADSANVYWCPPVKEEYDSYGSTEVHTTNPLSDAFSNFNLGMPVSEEYFPFDATPISDEQRVYEEYNFGRL